jgi:hypothetical protein
MSLPDPRLHAYRPDLAAVSLKGEIEAAAYVEGHPGQIAVPSTALRPVPDIEAAIDTELLYGEPVTVYEEKDGWAWVRSGIDGYVGYLAADTFSYEVLQSNYQVNALRTFVYERPDLKSPTQHLLSMNSLVTTSREDEDGFTELDQGGWIYRAHLVPCGVYQVDHAEVALSFLGTPYLWGGRTSLGLDCSALVQLSLMRCGFDVPRDSDLQETALDRDVLNKWNLDDLRHGDLVYWRGHCGIWLDSENFVHANATDMAVTCQPLERLLDPIAAATGDDAPRVRRV